MALDATSPTAHRHEYLRRSIPRPVLRTPIGAGDHSVKRLSFLLGIGASLVLSATALGAPSFTHATGSIGLTGPLQYASFNAFDYGATGDRGTVKYTNFEFGAAGSGVWNVSGTHALTTFLGASPYAHTMTIGSIVPTSPTSTTFS